MLVPRFAIEDVIRTKPEAIGLCQGNGQFGEAGVCCCDSRTCYAKSGKYLHSHQAEKDHTEPEEELIHDGEEERTSSRLTHVCSLSSNGVFVVA